MGMARAQIHLVQFFGARHTHLVQFPGVKVTGHSTHSCIAFSWGQCHWVGHTNTWCSFLGSRSLGRAHTHLVQLLHVSVIKLGTQAHLAISWGLGNRAQATRTHSPGAVSCSVGHGAGYAHLEQSRPNAIGQELIMDPPG